MRAAPVQISYLGYLGTMAAPYIDYLIADRTIVPAAHQRDYAEKLVYLPSYQANDSTRQISSRRFTRADLRLPAAGFVFCCFNAGYKITPDVFASWLRILHRVETGVLWLYAYSEAATRNLRAAVHESGLDPGRIVFGDYLPMPDYLARYRVADLFLDTLPYNAGTTASDALWAGLPVLTRAGNTFASRVAASLLTAVGLPELITATVAEYEDLAVELATSPPRLAAIRQRLAANRLSSPLFDSARFTRSLESAYGVIYDRCVAGLPPEHIDVDSNA
jgi:predicted O-linked N-acetylglucosamine transferase (SPINDLY family)